MSATSEAECRAGLLRGIAFASLPALLFWGAVGFVVVGVWR